MASNYSYMNNNTGGTNYTQQQQKTGMDALSNARQNMSTAAIVDPAPGATLTQGGGGGVTAPPRQYAIAPTYGPSNSGYAGANPLFQYPQGQQNPGGRNDPKTGASPGTYSPTAQELFPMTPMSGFSNSEDWFRNRENQSMLGAQMSMLPYYQTAIQTGTNVRDFNEDVRRFNLNTDHTQQMDFLNYGLSSQDRQLNWAGLNEGARQFDQMMPLQWAQQGTQQYGADTSRMVGMGGVMNDMTRIGNDFTVQMGGLRNEADANRIREQLGVEQNRIADLAARGVISDNEATQQFRRMELAANNALGWAGQRTDQYGADTQRMLGQGNLTLQDVMNQRQMQLEYARLQQQQQQANAQSYGRFATPNVSRTRRNF